VLLQSDEEGLLSSIPESPIVQHEKLQEPDSPILKHEKLQEPDSHPGSPIAKHENPNESEHLTGDEE